MARVPDVPQVEERIQELRIKGILERASQRPKIPEMHSDNSSLSR